LLGLPLVLVGNSRCKILKASELELNASLYALDPDPPIRLEAFVLIPTKVDSDSDLIPVTRSDAMPVTFGAKRRWRLYGA
jgi:hypothetical protein